jgi:hypothetical protein
MNACGRRGRRPSKKNAPLSRGKLQFRREETKRLAHGSHEFADAQPRLVQAKLRFRLGDAKQTSDTRMLVILGVVEKENEAFGEWSL